ncbi:NAD(P)H-dependent flavin oxidoreductase [Halomicroarcula sp. GCM10025709]|uniref:NAD(P)H-dependent flavin oxidoreductase n=1 Tax=Haloarcula TaxID=2237 RepID=UPI0024C2F155|nr:nitronate monooxygenase [Halomicroarcula sp. YJ-61-S]
MSSLRTPLCDAIGTDHPIVQAPVGSVSTPELAAAVADAGGLGLLAMSWRDAESIVESYERATDLTDGVVGVNVVLDESTGVDDPEACLETCLDAGASVVSFSFGDAADSVERVHEAGGTAMVTVGSAQEARDAAAGGADVVVAQGAEAGGHVQSDVTTMSLVPRVADAVDVPVVAAGGIGDGRGLAAVLALGADGAWLGTRFVATRESGAHDAYRGALVDASETDTRVTEAFDRGWPGQPHRALATPELRRGEHDDRPGEGEPVAHTPGGDPVERYADLPPIEGVEGDIEALPHYAGQSVGLTDDVPAAGAVVDALVGEARTALGALPDAR